MTGVFVEESGSFAELSLVETERGRLVLKRARDTALKPDLTAIESAAILFVTGGIKVVEPDCNELLLHQIEFLKAWRNIEGVVKIDEGGNGNGNGKTQYRMEYLLGTTARDAFVTGSFSADMFLELLAIVVAIENSPTFNYHGDLKPENIMCTDKGIKLIDPGYFGPLNTIYGREPRVPVTTAIYYPLLKPDDVLALGILLWECVLSLHPFMHGNVDDESYDESLISAELLGEVAKKERVGQHIYSAILSLKLPGNLRSDMTEAMERFLLKALRLKLNEEGKLAPDSGFGTAAEFRNSFAELKASGGLLWRLF